MKEILKKIPLESKIAILAAILIVVATQIFSKEFTIQYLEDGELVTETFQTREDFNDRAFELQTANISYWINLE